MPDKRASTSGFSWFDGSSSRVRDRPWHSSTSVRGDGAGTYDGQTGHAYIHLDDGSTGDEGRDLGLVTLTGAARIAHQHAAEVDIDGPTCEEWDE